MSTLDSQKNLLIHSEAKVDFYKKYLEKYLGILFHSIYIEEINIYDLFCGIGIYDNGKKGSPIVAFELIKNLKEKNKNKNINKTINLFINDSDKEKIDFVTNYINNNNQNYCNFNDSNEEFSDIVNSIVEKLRITNNKSRNLIFIDPYGYKDIKKEQLFDLLNNKKTEIILFLPITHMHRFIKKALSSDEKQYEPLYNFIKSFFLDENHKIYTQEIDKFELIEYIKNEIRFTKYYSTSYFIQRDSRNYFALFFVCSHIFGFEKILETKWELDESSGRGFSTPQKQGLFDDQFRKDDKDKNYNILKDKIIDFLQISERNNNEIYKFVLENEFTIQHFLKIINSRNDNSLFKILDKNGNILKKIVKDDITHKNLNKDNKTFTIKLKQNENL